MKKWMILSIAVILAGCGDVSVDNKDETHDTGTGTNTECNSNDDCKMNVNDTKCNADHKCVQCTGDTDCINGTCESGVCVSNVEQETCNEENCLDGKCEGNVCVKEKVIEDVKYECSDPKFTCDNNTIKVRCDENEEWADLYRCSDYCYDEDGDPKCVECVYEDDAYPCADGMICNAMNKCEAVLEPIEPECENSSDCLDSHNPICREGKCSGCQSESECQEKGDDLVCDATGVCVVKTAPPGCTDFSSTCNGDEELVIVCDANEHRIKCSCEIDETGNGRCLDEPECEYVWGCDAGNNAINLYCKDENGVQGTEPQMDTSIQCGSGEVCDEGQCKPVTEFEYGCDNTEMIAIEVKDKLNQLGATNEAIFDSCMKKVVTKESDLADWEKENRCLVICGNLEIGHPNQFSSIQLDNNTYVIGVNNAKVTSKESLVTPLFNKLDNVKLMDLTLRYNLTLSENTRAILANISENNTEIRNVVVDHAKLSYQNDEGVYFEDIGGLIGTGTDTSIVNVKMNQCEIELVNPHEGCDLDALYRFNNVGGIIGHASNVKIQDAKMDTITIKAGKSASVGGMVGRADHVLISGTYGISNDNIDNKDVSGVKISDAERDAGGLIGSSWGSFSVDSLNLSIDKVETHLPCSGGIIGYSWGRTYDSNSIRNINIKVNNVNGGQYSGGLVGLLHGAGLTIDHANTEINKIESKKYDCATEGDSEKDGVVAGGLVGGIRNDASLTVKNTQNKFNQVVAVSFAGGLLGGVTDGQAMIAIENVDNMSDNGVSATNQYAGGLIASAGYKEQNIKIYASSLDIQHVLNEVKKVEATDGTAGGLIGMIHGQTDGNNSFSISDVVNRHKTGQSVEGKIYLGGFIGNVDVKTITINNIVNETTIKSTGSDSGGFINDLAVRENSHIDDVISKSSINQSHNYSGGFLRRIRTEGVVDKQVIEVRNILNKSDVSAGDSDDDNGIGGFVANINVDKGKFCSSNNCVSIVKIRDVLSETDLFNNTKVYRSGNIVSYMVNKGSINCSSTSKTSYGENKDSIKDVIRTIFSNVYYSTLGYNSQNWPDNKWEGSVKALTWCGGPKDGDRENKYDAKANDGVQCARHRYYKTAVSGCWFTDYIYHQNFVYNSSSIEAMINSLNPGDIPIKPYHPYSINFLTNNTSTNYALDESTKDTERNNIDAVLDELNGNGNNRWTKCSEISALVNYVKDRTEFDHLLCPVLSGKLTCMGNISNDGTFDPNGKCD